jgi:IS30 family transposase
MTKIYTPEQQQFIREARKEYCEFATEIDKQKQYTKELFEALVDKLGIEKMLRERKSISYIAMLINRSKSSVSTEISRNGGRSRYKHIRASERQIRKQTLKKRKNNAVISDSVTRKRVDRMLAKGLSPEVISSKLIEHKSSKRISSKSIRKYRDKYYKP